MAGRPPRAPLVWLGAVLAGVVLLAGCASQRHATRQQQVMPAAAVPPAPCAAQHCAAGATVPLTGGYAVRLWAEPQPSQASSGTPVVELLHGGQHAGWWTGRLGFGWSATLTCLATAAEPNCVITSALGAHAGSAETVLLRDGALVSPATASVVFDSSTPTAADLDRDGLLDVIGMENDYKPNYALGHNYWATYRLAGTALHRTGCAPATTSPAPPRALLHGPCPVVAGG